MNCDLHLFNYATEKSTFKDAGAAMIGVKSPIDPGCYGVAIREEHGTVRLFISEAKDARAIAAAFIKCADMIDSANGVVGEPEMVPGHSTPATAVEVEAITKAAT